MSHPLTSLLEVEVHRSRTWLAFTALALAGLAAPGVSAADSRTAEPGPDSALVRPAPVPSSSVDERMKWNDVTLKK